MYREKVTSADLLFYPLGGDPIKLSGYMVKTHGKLIPNLLDRQEVRELTRRCARKRFEISLRCRPLRSLRSS